MSLVIIIPLAPIASAITAPRVLPSLDVVESSLVGPLWQKQSALSSGADQSPACSKQGPGTPRLRRTSASVQDFWHWEI